MKTPQTLPSQIICPQMGMEPRSNIIIRKARRAFNEQRWRKDIRQSIADRNWNRVTWLEKYYDVIIQS